MPNGCRGPLSSRPGLAVDVPQPGLPVLPTGQQVPPVLAELQRRHLRPVVRPPEQRHELPRRHVPGPRGPPAGRRGTAAADPNHVGLPGAYRAGVSTGGTEQGGPRLAEAVGAEGSVAPWPQLDGAVHVGGAEPLALERERDIVDRAVRQGPRWWWGGLGVKDQV